MIFGLKIKLLIAVAAAGLVFGAGWLSKGWLEDSKDLVALKAQQALANDLRDSLGQVSKDVEAQLAGLRPSERIIDRGVVREIQTEVFRNVCVPPGSDSFRLLNGIAAGKDPGELTGEGTQDTPATD